jgi:F-type H+-transporting ATPase subunit b
MRCVSWLAIVLFLTAAPVCLGLAKAAGAPAEKGGGGHPAPPAGDDSPFAGETHQILDLAIWTVVVFLILLFVLSKFAWKPMLQSLQKREQDIHSAIEEAHKTREEARRLHEQLQAEMNQAAQKVRGMLDEARRDAEQAKADLIAAARAEIQTERERLHREIQVETDQALQSLWTRAAELATQVSAAALGRQIDGDGHRRLIDEALAELKTATKQGANGHA